MELWDAYDRFGNLTGGTLERDRPVPEGLHHLVCCVLVQHADGEYLLMRRDLNKKNWPGYYEASAGGAVQKGETLLEGARRELREETGITAGEMKPYFAARDADCLYGGYICRTECPKDSIVLQEKETIGYRWVSREELIAMMEAEPFEVIVQAATRNYFGLETPHPAEEYRMVNDAVETDDFVKFDT